MKHVDENNMYSKLHEDAHFRTNYVLLPNGAFETSLSDVLATCHKLSIFLNDIIYVFYGNLLIKLKHEENSKKI